MIQMKNVYKKYPNGIVALNGLNVEIAQGEFVYIVGPSGAGKSTFIKMMYREERPSSGQMLVDGKDIAKLKNRKVPFSRHRRRVPGFQIIAPLERL